MNETRLMERLRALGFTTYESKAYITLLKNNPSTRYELSKNSGVPRSAIYDVIKKLENMGAVNALYTSPEKYVPLPPEQLLELLERQFKERIEEARSALKHFDTQIEPGHLWNIVGYRNMLHKAREMISRAEKIIFLSVWDRECKRLKEDLDAARQRGVRIIVFSFTPLNLEGEEIYSYNIPEKELLNIWERKIILVVDHVQLLMGEADDRYTKKTAWTDNKAIVDIATNHIILDITLYGIRMKEDVSHSVVAMQQGAFENLDKLIEKYKKRQIEPIF
ncbi:TrmB family transcriptional regulator [Caldithrix abyssi]|uniref:Sugar-specific transcriptional regulator TrmB n=1 Tax=Caldithrix abyssi DSM 13497 TaxID=880073 RepID=H1XUQ0_CALAY|nr:helix-turn-helix domain-containing protein [Caldithrix abyssi]APF16785.1 Sugar-specific transcriptional regulator TrmB [Caldithrix abyssi DSM 13497]EHO40549.1 transcriptional regulator, TrmB [Caldithrix abyssi DSM 13497]